MSSIEFYRCERCGNIAALVKKGGGVLACCGQSMTKLEPNTTDAAQEKHVPVVVHAGGKLQVTVGSTEHPMLEKHYIEWIALVSGDRVEIHYLHPGETPMAAFADADTGTVFAYCNLHGLWKADF